MEPVPGTHKAPTFASKDIISSMPKNVITDILDRLPIQEAVRTCILSRDWRLNWTMLTQLVFDEKFFEFLLRTNGEMLFYRRHLSLFLLHFEGVITKFVLYIPRENYNVLELDLKFHRCKFLTQAGARKRVSVAFPCLKSLTLRALNLNNRVMVLCAFDLIHCSTNLQTLKITVDQEKCVSIPPLCSWEINSGLSGKLQLRSVELECIRDSEIEICLIKALLAYSSALLAYSSLLKKMIINHKTARMHDVCHGNCTFAKKLLKLHRASPIAEIDLD